MISKTTHRATRSDVTRGGLDVKTYRTKHVVEGCTCADVEPNFLDVLRIINCDGIPIVTWDGLRSYLVVSEFRPGPTLLPEVQYDAEGHPIVLNYLQDYVAISHV